jgi:P-loop Domain of unknown function (DUF2791)
MNISNQDIKHIFERLRSGVVPERGLEAFAVGVDRSRTEMKRQLDLVINNEGGFKFLRGGYGCGKTFMSRLALIDAQSHEFATSFVVVSDNDLHFHKFDDVYRKVVQELGTSECERGALSFIIDRWIGRVEAALIAGGSNPDNSDFDDKVERRIEEDLNFLTRGKAPQDMIRVLRWIFKLKQNNETENASALISWLSGSSNVAAKLLRIAGIRGRIGSNEAMDYLQGILAITKAAGYKGLVIAIDEVETILRMRTNIRSQSLNGIRQICDAADGYPGLLWIFTGTPEFFDTNRGVAGLAPLNARLKLIQNGDFVSLLQPQLVLTPFDAERLKELALKLRKLYPTDNRSHLNTKVTPEFIDLLVAEVTKGFAGDVGIVPREFLRAFVTILDLASTEPEFDPMKDSGYDLKPNAEEIRMIQGKSYFQPESEEGDKYAVTF